MGLSVVAVAAGAVIGSDGFSFVTPGESGVEEIRRTLGQRRDVSAQSWVRIHSLGGVEIGDDVEIGANSTIDRGTVRATQVGEGGAAGMVAVFEEVARLVGATRAEIDAEHRFDIDLVAPVHEFVGAELVGLG